MREDRKVRCMYAKIGTKHSPLEAVRYDKYTATRQYRCPDCRTLQEVQVGDDGVERWRFTPYKWNLARANRICAQISAGM